MKKLTILFDDEVHHELRLLSVEMRRPLQAIGHQLLTSFLLQKKPKLREKFRTWKNAGFPPGFELKKAGLSGHLEVRRER